MVSKSQQAIGYIRVSTDGQAESGLGLADQQQAIEQYAKRQGLHLIAIESDEGVSGSKGLEGRPGLLAALDGLSRGSTLIVAKRDRLARDYVLAGWLDIQVKARGASVVSLDNESMSGDDPQSRLLRGIIDLFADFERSMIAARTKAALQQKRKQGKRFSRHTPYGYTLTSQGDLVENKAELATVARMKDLHNQGQGFSRIARHLNEQGIATKQGKTWSAKVVRSLILRESAA